MQLQPKKTKHRKYFRLKYDKPANKGNTLVYAKYGIQALSGDWVSSRQIEAARQAITRYTKRDGKLWIRVFPHLPITRKPLEVRMGSGKGSIDHWVAVVKKNTIIFELGGVKDKMAIEALRLGTHKLSVKCKIISKDEEIKK